MFYRSFLLLVTLLLHSGSVDTKFQKDSLKKIFIDSVRPAVLHDSRTAAGVFSPKIAFSDKAQSFLSVYSIQHTDSNGIYGVIIDRRGRGPSHFEIYRGSVMDVRIAYLVSMDRYLVVFTSTPDGYTYLLMGQIISSDGNLIGNPFQITSSRTEIGGFEVIADAFQSGFLVVWLSYNRICGQFLDPDGRFIGKEIEVLISTDYNIINFDIVVDPESKGYFVFYSSYSLSGGNEISIKAALLDSGLYLIGVVDIGISNDISCQLSAACNDVDKLFFLVFTDYVVGANYYQIKGILTNGKGDGRSFPLAIEKSFSSRSPEVIFNEHNNLFSVVYQSENLITNTSNIIVKDVDSNGSIVTEYRVDRGDTSYLFSPSIAANSLCGNEVAVYIDFDHQLTKNNYASMLIGGLCRFSLNVSKIGDGEGSISSKPSGIDCGSSCNAIFEDGERVELSALPYESSLFTGYTGAGCGVEPICYLTVDSESSLQAEFMLKRFTINTISTVGGRIEPENPVVKYGESQTFLISPLEGYYLDDVVVDGESVGRRYEYTFENVSQDHTIYATFKPYSDDASVTEDAGVNIYEDATWGGIAKTTVKEGPSSGGCGCTLLK